MEYAKVVQCHTFFWHFKGQGPYLLFRCISQFLTSMKYSELSTYYWNVLLPPTGRCSSFTKFRCTLSLYTNTHRQSLTHSTFECSSRTLYFIQYIVDFLMKMYAVIPVTCLAYAISTLSKALRPCMLIESPRMLCKAQKLLQHKYLFSIICIFIKVQI